jgi:hypothetical protein
MNFRLKLENSFDFFLLFIIIIKIVFVIATLGHLVASHSNNIKISNTDSSFVELKEYTEFIFTIAMSILILYHFNPYVKRVSVDEESKFLFFIFGIIIILTSNWNLFFKESPLYKLAVKSFAI